MITPESVIGITALIIGSACSIQAWRYARGQVRKAEELRRQGWVCIGCNFLTGPIMVPRDVAEKYIIARRGI